MSNSLYIGFRVEIASRLVAVKNLIKQYNSNHTKTKIFDLHSDGKITVEKTEDMLIARGKKADKGPTGVVNFSVMTEMNKEEEVERIVKIINVLGNDRLIRERIEIFMKSNSTLNAIPELNALKNAFEDLDSIMPGFVNAGWYYAPEAKLE